MLDSERKFWRWLSLGTRHPYHSRSFLAVRNRGSDWHSPLLTTPKSYFLDEPTSGLDPRARRNIWKVIKALKERGKSILLTTHCLEKTELLADRVAIMNKGRIIDAGTPMEIVKRTPRG